MTPEPSSARDVDFARLAGELADSFHFNRSLGQIYGLLFLQDAPLSLEEISRRLSMSKGNASVNIRLLESWGAVRPISQVGSRKDFYEANRDIKKVALRRLKEGLSKRLDHAEDQLGHFLSKTNGASATLPLKRVQTLQTLLTQARRTLKLMAPLISR